MPQSDQQVILAWFQMFADRMNTLVKDKGLKQTVLVVKQVQLHLTRYLAGDPLYVNDVRVGLYKDGLPKLLRGDLTKVDPLASPTKGEGAMFALVSLIRSRDPAIIRGVLTALSVTRVHLGSGELAPASIVGAASSSEEVESDIMSWLVNSQWGRDTKRDFCALVDKNKWTLPHLSTKAGPNGQAMGTAVRDAELLSPELVKAINIVGGKNLKDYLWTIRDSISTIPHWVAEKVSRKSFLRRLSVIRDKALKNRPIAILDYWSQSALLPLHKTLMGVLAKKQEDMTFNQMGVVKFLGLWPSYHCLDLSSATDRFPVSLQEKILAWMTSDQYAMSWRYIMVGLPFKYEGEEYYYGAGQPMGAYSSWAMFALSHHAVIQYCMHKARVTGSLYAVLGDDVVIGHQEVANLYKETINSLGVEVSPSKTHEGKTLCEFAKNTWLIDGDKPINVSGVPLPGVLEALGNPFQMSQELSRSIEKGILDNTSVPVSRSLLCFVEGWVSKRSRERMVRLIQDWWACTEALNWVRNYKTCSSGPRPLHCTRQPSTTYEAFKEILTEDLKDVLGKMRRDLIRNMQEADRKNNLLYDEILAYHESGPDRDSLPNLGGIMYQPWYWAMEYQVKLVDDAYEKVRGDRFSSNLGMEWEEIITMISSLRISDPHRLDSRRTAEIVSANKRKQFALLLPYVRSQ